MTSSRSDGFCASFCWTLFQNIVHLVTKPLVPLTSQLSAEMTEPLTSFLEDDDGDYYFETVTIRMKITRQHHIPKVPLDVT